MVHEVGNKKNSTEMGNEMLQSIALSHSLVLSHIISLLFKSP